MVDKALRANDSSGLRTADSAVHGERTTAASAEDTLMLCTVKNNTQISRTMTKTSLLSVISTPLSRKSLFF